jgi:Na+/proline symporter
MARRAKTYQYRDTTVAFTLQVAVTVYFIFWGYRYGWGNLFYIFTWYLGLLVFWWMSPWYLPHLARHKTLFQFLEQTTSPTVRVLITVLSGFSLLGLAYVELFYGSQFASEAMAVQRGEAAGPGWFWLSFILVAVVVAIYTGVGGMRRVVTADILNLSIAYVAAAAVIGYLLLEVAKHNPVGPVVLVGTCSTSAFLLIGYLGSTGRNRFGSSWGAFLAALVVAIFTVVGSVLSHSGQVPIYPADALSQVAEPYGWVPLAGFAMANAVWQLADFTAYQRLRIIEVGDDQLAARGKVRKAIATTMWASPLTWGIGIFIGIGARAAQIGSPDSESPFVDLIRHLASTAESNELAYLGFIGLGCMVSMVMVSSVDCTYLSLCQLIEADLLQGRTHSLISRIVITMTLCAMLVAFAILHMILEWPVLVVLSTCYSLMLAIGPVTFVALRSNQKYPVTAALAVTVPVLAAIIAAYFADDNMAIGLPLIAVVGLSTVICAVGGRLERH